MAAQPVMAHMGSVLAAQEKTMRQQQEAIATLREELETVKSALADNAKAVSMFDSLPDEVVIIKVPARHGGDKPSRGYLSRGSCPPLASSHLAIQGRDSMAA